MKWPLIFTMNQNISRKDFIKHFFKFMSAQNNADTPVQPSTNSYVPGFLLPPGSRTIEHFLSNCDQCYECVSICPYEAIRVFRQDTNDSMYGYPIIDPRQQPCHLCNDFPCIAACSTQALQAVGDKPKLGTAVIDNNRCFAYNSHFCHSCLQNCMFPDQAIRLDERNRPQVHSEYCTGCGFCTFSCPVKPSAINISIHNA
ncbi:MAG: hypothetical protein GF313_02455 [Caldithrix sp.]|nr:hypothetical protein [Caldithrix sp.]